MCIRVDLPDPDGPVIATNSFSSMRMETPVECVHLDVALAVGLGDVDQLDDRRRGLVGAAHGALPRVAAFAPAPAPPGKLGVETST